MAVCCLATCRVKPKHFISSCFFFRRIFLPDHILQLYLDYQVLADFDLVCLEKLMCYQVASTNIAGEN